jgi:hypothetical protein
MFFYLNGLFNAVIKRMKNNKNQAFEFLERETILDSRVGEMQTIFSLFSVSWNLLLRSLIL